MIVITKGLSYRLMLTGYFVLLSLLLIWPTWLSPPRRLPVAVVLIMTVVPLLFPLRGLLHGRTRSTTWAGYLSLFYFVHAVTEAGAFETFREGFAVSLELAGSLLLYLGTVFYLKAVKGS